MTLTAIRCLVNTDTIQHQSMIKIMTCLNTVSLVIHVFQLCDWLVRVYGIIVFLNAKSVTIILQAAAAVHILSEMIWFNTARVLHFCVIKCQLTNSVKLISF